MKVLLISVQTINGYIARNNYSEDFLSDENWKIFTKLAEDVGCIIVGRKTYDLVKKWKEYNYDSIKCKKIIISKNTKLKLPSNYILANSPEDALKKAKELKFKKVLVAGGSNIYSSFMKKNLVYEIIINIEPFVLGKGITIFAENNFENKLKLINIKKLKEEIVQLHYKVKI